MFESSYSWWFLLLLGVWMAGLMVWRHPGVTNEMRWGAGFLSLVYAGMLFVALRVDRTAMGPATANGMYQLINHWPIVLNAIVVLAIALMLISPIREEGERFWLSLLLLSLSSLVGLMGISSVAIALGVLGLCAFLPLVVSKSIRRGQFPAVVLHKMTTVSRDHSITGHIPSVTLMGLVLSVLFIGTIAHALRIEKLRATASHRFSAMPSSELIRTTLSTSPPKQEQSKSGSLTLMMSRRADVVVLLAVILFMMLGASGSSKKELVASRVDNVPAPDFLANRGEP